MRYLVLSDLHSNLEATRAVIADARAQGYDRAVCLGDIVGYGGDPNGVVSLVRDLNPHTVVRGNHDKVAAGIEEGENFSEIALEAALWTRRVLSPQNRDWLASLPKGPVDAGGFLLSHGTPLDEDAYILNEFDAVAVFGAMEAPLAFFGHSHFACTFELRDGRLAVHVLEGEEGVLRLAPGSRHLVNPGSIGQPRNHDPRAAYLIYDDAAGVVSARRVAYDVAAAQRRITEQGLPEPLARRLEYGI